MFSNELKLGLMSDPPRKSVFYMANTFVTHVPDGSEEGDFLSMDLGNSNLRFILTTLKPGEEPKFNVRHYQVDAAHRRGKPEDVTFILIHLYAIFIYFY